MQIENSPRRPASGTCRRGSQQAGRTARAKENKARSFCGLPKYQLEQLRLVCPEPCKALAMNI